MIELQLGSSFKAVAGYFRLRSKGVRASLFGGLRTQHCSIAADSGINLSMERERERETERETEKETETDTQTHRQRVSNFF